jgi:adenosine deaminase
MNVLRKEEDFADLADAYLKKAASQGVVHVEMFFDPQAHTQRGIALETVMDGLWDAVSQSSEKYGISSKLIMCFLRDLSPESAMETLESATKYGERIVAVGLDSAEVNNPPSKFEKVFEKAKAEGFLTVAHAGEEGPPAYVWQALDLLKVSRIDHGVRSLEDEKLVSRLVDEQMPLTVCPLSNVKLRVFKDMKDHNIGKMLERGIRATVNSDDPAYFGGYVADNFTAIKKALNVTDDEIVQLAKNSILASFITSDQRHRYLAMIDKAVGKTAEPA